MCFSDAEILSQKWISKICFFEDLEFQVIFVCFDKGKLKNKDFKFNSYWIDNKPVLSVIVDTLEITIKSE